MTPEQRDAVLALCKEAWETAPVAVVAAIRLLVDAMPVEESYTKPRGDAPQDGNESGKQNTPASPGAALSSTEPDFAAMVEMHVGTALVNAQASYDMWDRGQHHTFSFREGLRAVITSCTNALDLLKRRPKQPVPHLAPQAPAFDVEELIRRADDYRWKHGVSWTDGIRAVVGSVR